MLSQPLFMSHFKPKLAVKASLLSCIVLNGKTKVLFSLKSAFNRMLEYLAPALKLIRFDIGVLYWLYTEIVVISLPPSA